MHIPHNIYIFFGTDTNIACNSNFSALNVLDCRCGAELCRGKLERRDAKKMKETLAASLKRKLIEASASATPEPTTERTTIKKRKTGRWSKGWSYIDPEMEALRLKEDAIENGRDIDARALEVLKAEEERKEAEKSKGQEVGGRGTRNASVAAKAKLLERASSVRSALGRRNGDAKKAEKRKSLLSRAASVLRTAAQAVEGADAKEEEDGVVVATTARFSFDEEKPLNSVEENHVTAVVRDAGKGTKMKQTTLSFAAVSAESEAQEEEDVLEMVLNASTARKVSV